MLQNARQPMKKQFSGRCWALSTSTEAAPASCSQNLHALSQNKWRAYTGVSHSRPACSLTTLSSGKAQRGPPCIWTDQQRDQIAVQLF